MSLASLASLRRMAAGVAAAAVCLVGGIVMAPSAGAVDVPPGSLVSPDPAAGTPYVLNGRVLSIQQVGNLMVAGGTFSSVSNAGGPTVARANLFAFDVTSGAVSTSFLPQPNGTVEAVLPTGDGQSVYVAGSFSSIGGVARKNLARVRLSDGAVITSFNAGNVTGVVKDLRLVNGRLWIAGGFTHVNGTPRLALATLNPTTGALTNFSTVVIAGTHNGGFTTVAKIDTDPAGTRLVGIGNFDTVNGLRNHQLFMLDISGAAAAPAGFVTGFYLTPCSGSFNSYMRDLDFSPDGSFFVVSTTGAYGGPGVACDSTARFETAAVGADVQPSWLDNTGGDTTYAVEITDSVVYVGGHQRWQNNAYAGDTPGAGAVSRPGIAALSPINGLPYSWNPTRDRGVGVFDFYVNSRGLWVGSDTQNIGNEYHPRLALLPVAGGTGIAQQRTPSVPNQIYSAGLTGAATDARILYRVNAAGPMLPADTGIDWAGDTAENPSLLHNQVSNRADWGSLVPAVDANVPSSTPRSIFNTELWDPWDGTEQSWNFPVTAGTPVQLRLYFADRCGCTATPGSRVFDVSVEGNLVIDDFDINASVGHDIATMRSFDLVSDGSIDVTLGHVVENPLINGIEILRTDISAGTPLSITRRPFTGSSVGPEATVADGGLNWSAVRGSFMLNGQLYLAWADGTFDRRSFDGTSFGPAIPVNTQDQLVVLADWHSDVAAMTGMFFTFGRVYFTRAGSTQLYYRFFEPESAVVGAVRYVASESVAGADFGQVRGMVLGGDMLYWASPDGALHSVNWQHGAQSGAPVAGSGTIVSGPGADGVSWQAHDFFLYQDAAGNPAPVTGNVAPTAAISVTCTALTCTFSGAGSTDPDGTITDYAWAFGDGTTATGVNPTHPYAAAGSYTATLTVTDNGGATATATQTVTVAPAATATVSFVAAASSNGNRTAHSVVVPGAVQAGDALVVFLTTNTAGTIGAPPAGWTALPSLTGSSLSARAWTRTATATDPGATFTVNTAALAKSDLSIAAYRASAGSVAVLASAGNLNTTGNTTVTSPSVPVTTTGSWVLTYWARKSSSTTSIWAVPAGQVLRTQSVGSGGGNISAMLTDSNGPVPVGTGGGVTATLTEGSSQVPIYSVVVGLS